ncbi:MAG: hypothetical protein WKG32_05445 [Gemmatimonadaceae bacterium]
MPHSPSRARAATVLCAVALASGCSTLRERFPKRDAVFVPVALSIGEMRVTGSDTAYVVSGAGYELAAPTREALQDARPVIESGARAFRRYFAEDAPPVVVELRAMGRIRGDRRDGRIPPGVRGQLDSALTRAPERLPDGRRRVTVPLLTVRDERGRGAGNDFPAPPPTYIARPVIRAWLASYADAQVTGLSVVAASDSATEASRGDPRIPDWLETALYQLIAGSSAQDLLVAQLAAQPEGSLIPLRALVDSANAFGARDVPSREIAPPGEREHGGRGQPRSGRGTARLDRQMLFTAEALALARFLAEREGPEFIGRIAQRTIRGAHIDQALRDARNVPTDLDALEATFRSWLAQQRGNAVPGMRR